MKLHLLLLLALGLLIPVAARANYAFRESFDQTHAFRPNSSLTVENVNGDVIISTWDKEEIRVTGEKSAETDAELKQIDLRIELADSSASLKVKLPKRTGKWFGSTIRAAVRFEIMVPASTRIEQVGCVNSSIKLDGIRGPVVARSVNGGISARGLGGDADLHTVNGSVDVAFAAVAAGQKLSIETVNGGVRVHVPKDSGLDVDISTVNGGIDCDLPITLERSHHRHSLSGKVGDGRASFRARTVNGGVHIETL
jgi:DUF4097 and DUF4098 domain-containing protein YvlB